MKRFTLDFEFNEVTGSSRILVDFHDDSMTAIEINEAIRSGELLEEVVQQASQVFGENVGQQIRDGRLTAICLDNHPEEKGADAGIIINTEVSGKQEIKQ
ncbi:MAG: hypothetical protein PWR01_3207 [Clostridiales bacterium]|jgi:uncharacterized protein YbjQ (UPF0145 family)|nr:hypothetical protein [Clostridiales bacterium]MDN5282134.1 hypothetical protein [Candidatus Ozemobacter sp.]